MFSLICNCRSTDLLQSFGERPKFRRPIPITGNSGRCHQKLQRIASHSHRCGRNVQVNSERDGKKKTIYQAGAYNMGLDGPSGPYLHKPLNTYCWIEARFLALGFEEAIQVKIGRRLGHLRILYFVLALGNEIKIITPANPRTSGGIMGLTRWTSPLYPIFLEGRVKKIKV